MVEFYGELSDECKIDFAIRRSKRSGFIFLFVSMVVAIILLICGILRNTWIYALPVIGLFIVFTIIAYLPMKSRVLKFKIPSHIIVNNHKISTYAVIGGQAPIEKPLDKIKKVIDVGKWYYIIFKHGDITNAWVIEKRLIVSGSIEEFEEIFASILIKQR